MFSGMSTRRAGTRTTGRTAAPKAASPGKKPATSKPRPKAAAKTAAKARPPASKAKPKKAPAAKPALKTRTPAKTKAADPKPKAKRTPAPAPAAPKAKTPAKTKAAAPARKRTSRAPQPGASEVSYSGKVFRSRLEARWAILLDLLEINWDYEPCHYQVGPDLYYLPDFYLPEHRLWLEVKGPAFLDAQSMAKCLGSVAGPMPLPLRESPYTAADRLLLGGPFARKPEGRPVHTLITKACDGTAALNRATLDAGGVTALDEWAREEATGVSKARRPAPGKVAALLEPEPVRMPLSASLEAAYRFAATAVFDDTHRRLAHRNDWSMTSRLERRRSGRPLGPFAVQKVTPAGNRAA